MPNITVKERDLSWYYRRRDPSQLVVLMPGVAEFGPEVPTLVDSTNFKSLYGTKSVDGRDISYNMAASLIESGANVVFWRIPFEDASIATYKFEDANSTSYFESPDSIIKSNTTYYTRSGLEEPYSYTKVNPYLLEWYIQNTGTEGVISYTRTTDTSIRPSVNYYIKKQEAYTLVNPSADGLYYRKSNQSLVISAKYTGDYGNTLKVKVTKIAEYTFRVFVYDANSSILESLYINTNNPDSKYYYETVNNTSAYIDIFDESNQAYNSIPSETGPVSLTNGFNGTYDPNFVCDYLVSDEAKKIISDLSDLITYDFNAICAAGYNFKTDEHREASRVSRISPVDDMFIALAEQRGNTVYLVDSGRDWKPEEFYAYTGYPVSSNASVYTETRDTKLETDLSGNIKKYYYYKSSTGEYIEVSPANLEEEIYVNIGTEAIPDYQPSTDSTFTPGISYYVQKPGTDPVEYILVNPKSFKWYEFREITTMSSAGFNSSYVAAYGPWSSATYTSTGVTRELPGSYVLLISWAQSLSVGTPMYYAPAGVKRASVNFVSNTKYPVGKAILSLWQGDYSSIESHRINPIMKIKQYGYVIYGNSTLLRPLGDGSTSMLQSFSTRVLANMIKTQAFNISLTLQFDQMTDDLFAEFRTLMTTFMDQLKYNGALYDYRIVADRANTTLDSLNNRTVPVLIQISPNPAAENFDIMLEISQAGVSFSTDGEA